MEVINIKGTDDTPNVILDKASGQFELSGRSLPEDVNQFYEQILDWIDEYTKDPQDRTEFNFRLEYFNTASSKVILDILLKFEEIVENGKEVIIKWQYHDDDEGILEAGDEYSDIVEIALFRIVYSV